jgi:hypothetical protein
LGLFAFQEIAESAPAGTVINQLRVQLGTELDGALTMKTAFGGTQKFSGQ